MKRKFESYRENPMYSYLLLLVIATAIGFQGWRTLFNNYSVDVVGLNSVHVGAIQSVREIPGFLTFFVIYLLLLFREHRFAAFSVLLLGAGVLATGLFPTFIGVLGTTIIMSLGFHFFQTCNQSLTLQYFEGSRIPQILARFNSFTALTNIVVGLSIWGLAEFLPLKSIFFLLGAVVIVLALFAFRKNPVDEFLPPQQKKLILRRKYWLFYVLNFLSGARRQIFVVFAIFILVDKYHFSVTHITILFIVNNIITYFISPYVGRAINRYGERPLLTIQYSCLFLVFLGYAYIEKPGFATAMYIVDNLFFSFSIAINTYFRKHADAKDIAPSMAVGFTINHISAVLLPFLGGLLWLINWRIPFWGGAVLALASLIFSQMVKDPEIEKQPVQMLEVKGQ